MTTHTQRWLLPLPITQAGQLLWVADPSQPSLAYKPEDLATAATLDEKKGRLEVCFLKWRGGGFGFAISDGARPPPPSSLHGMPPSPCPATLPPPPRPAVLQPPSTPPFPHPPTLLQLSYPGAYRHVCIELHVNHLAVNAVLEASALGEIEGAALLDDQQGCGPAFRVLRELALSWMEDANKRNNMWVLVSGWGWYVSVGSGKGRELAQQRSRRASASNIPHVSRPPFSCRLQLRRHPPPPPLPLGVHSSLAPPRPSPQAHGAGPHAEAPPPARG